MRIVGGRLRGRALGAPKSQAIRPTADRLRESLFNILTHAYGDPIAGARVLDLFAGTGALGFEALSRGAAFALFVDDGAEGRALLRQNVEALGLAAVSKIFRRDAFLELPYFDHMHRYLITLMLREGHEVRFMPVGHRPRGAGRSKYGVWDRALVGLSDLVGVMWLKRRFRGPDNPKEL